MESNQAEQITEILQEVLDKLGVESKIETDEGVRGKIFNILSPDSNLLIGQRGANLAALQQVVNGIVFKKLQNIERFVIDVDDYRRKREWYLRETAKKAMEQIKRTRRPVVLEPMSPSERRVIHAFLSEDFNFETESVGEEPHRRIVIRPKSGI